MCRKKSLLCQGMCRTAVANHTQHLVLHKEMYGPGDDTDDDDEDDTRDSLWGPDTFCFVFKGQHFGI